MIDKKIQKATSEFRKSRGRGGGRGRGRGKRKRSSRGKKYLVSLEQLDPKQYFIPFYLLSYGDL